ncbi:hypothetical protein LTR85_009002 [Meristemomyces frigidus]|nr:hypothetical protein LTR85_009002 [Meristemomyces frigidus]
MLQVKVKSGEEIAALAGSHASGYRIFGGRLTLRKEDSLFAKKEKNWTTRQSKLAKVQSLFDLTFAAACRTELWASGYEDIDEGSIKFSTSERWPCHENGGHRGAGDQCDMVDAAEAAREDRRKPQEDESEAPPFDLLDHPWRVQVFNCVLHRQLETTYYAVRMQLLGTSWNNTEDYELRSGAEREYEVVEAIEEDQDTDEGSVEDGDQIEDHGDHDKYTDMARSSSSLLGMRERRLDHLDRAWRVGGLNRGMRQHSGPMYCTTRRHVIALGGNVLHGQDAATQLVEHYRVQLRPAPTTCQQGI